RTLILAARADTRRVVAIVVALFRIAGRDRAVIAHDAGVASGMNRGGTFFAGRNLAVFADDDDGIAFLGESLDDGCPALTRPNRSVVAEIGIFVGADLYRSVDDTVVVHTGIVGFADVDREAFFGVDDATGNDFLVFDHDV